MGAWEREAVFHEGERYFAEMIQAIGGARKSVDLESYIFDRDELGERVLTALSLAVRNGAQVRLLLDGVGCAQWNRLQLGEVRSRGIQARFFHPLPWQSRRFNAWRALGLFRIRTFLLALGRLNRRNHRKTCIIDGTTAFLGGMNVSARHLERGRGPAWRDTAVRVDGTEVRRLTEAFELAWSGRAKGGARTRPRSSRLVRLNATRRQRRAEYQALLRRVLAARERIWLATPYFVPELSLLRALRFSAWAGTDVRLLLPARNDVWGMKWAIRASYLALLSAGVKIYEYRPSVLHAKISLIDSWSRVGSSNLNHRSLLHDLEGDVILTRPESLQAIQERLERDYSDSYRIDLASLRRRTGMRRFIDGFLENLALVFRRWL